MQTTLDEKLWVLDKPETFALSGWLQAPRTIRLVPAGREVKTENAVARI
jgi:hypothetical protein